MHHQRWLVVAVKGSRKFPGPVKSERPIILNSWVEVIRVVHREVTSVSTVPGRRHRRTDLALRPAL